MLRNKPSEEAEICYVTSPAKGAGVLYVTSPARGAGRWAGTKFGYVSRPAPLAGEKRNKSVGEKT